MKKTEQALRAKYWAIFREREKDTTQPISVFCKKRGISPAAFYRWKNILGLPTRRDFPRERFIPLTVGPLSPPTTDSARHCYDFRFPNGATLQISGSLDTADLSELIRTLGKLAP
ncbi:MAG: hypothetical protein WBM07_12060 [Chitinivibrionales bacterium]